jgi:hypothetical protein
MASTTAIPNASAALASTIEEELSVIHLTTPMTLAPNTKIIVTCSSDIKFALEQYPELSTCVSAIFPTTITTTSRTAIEPSGALGEEFVRRWRALPQELRLRVLHFNLLSDKGVVDCLPPSRVGQKRYENQLTLFKFLSMGPDIASLALEAYYKANKFLIFHAQACIRPLFPRPSIRPWIARVALVVALSQYGWDLLTRLALDGYGFKNLRFVEIRILLAEMEMRNVHQLLNNISQNPDVFGIQFKCGGSMDVVADEWDFVSRNHLAMINWTLEGVGESVRKAIQFKA